MGLHLNANNFIYEVGSSDFLIAFFDTIEVNLTKGLFSKKYPLILKELYNGRLLNENLVDAQKELLEIQNKLKKYDVSKLIWDKTDPSKQPPWGDKISDEITDLSNYFVTSDGRDLFGVINRAIEQAKKENSDLVIE